MKCINELGISPWPWSVVKAVNAECGRSLIVKSSGGEIPTLLPQNARLIAAAPEMYERLYTIVHHVVCSCTRKDCETCNANTCWVKKAKAVLAKAAGEKEGSAK